MRIILVFSLLVLLSGCGPQKITTTYRVEPAFPRRYQTILVVAVLPDADSMLRKTIETETVVSLTSYGYNTVSAIAVFGPKGLAAAGEEATYLKLCSNEIDAVMTLALVPKGKEIYHPGTSQYIHTNNYYYNRIWDYKKMQPDMVLANPEDEYYWESILFDLRTLQATSIIRTRPFTTYNREKINNSLVRMIMKKMTKEKIIRKRSEKLKAF
jgi:hypothetical protein